VKIARAFGTTVEEVLSLLLAVKIARAFGTTVEEVFKFDEDETKLES
jgi:DNA-binding XRE family transcriptional regulator